MMDLQSMIMLLGMVYVCNYRCSTCILTNITHLHAPNHRFHNKLKYTSVVLYVTLGNQLIQWYNVSMVVMRRESGENKFLNVVKYSNEKLMKTHDSCRIQLKGTCNFDVRLRKCMNVIMKTILLSLNYLFCSTICRKNQCQSALINMLYTIMMTCKLVKIMIIWAKQNVILIGLPLFNATLSSLWKLANLSARKHAKNHLTFWCYKKRYFLYSNRECHPKTTTYLHALCSDVHFGIFHCNFYGLVNPKSKKNTKNVSRKVKYQSKVGHDTKLGQGHRACALAPPVKLSTSDTQRFQKTLKNGFFEQNETTFQNMNVQKKNMNKVELLHQKQVENKQVKTGKQRHLFFTKILKKCHHDQTYIQRPIYG